MQKVVSNSSPLIHLAKIDKLELLRKYFHQITIPEAVYRECTEEGKDRPEVAMLKDTNWIKVLVVRDQRLIKLLQSSLDAGESESIALALEIGADLILLDNSDAREKARLYGLKITGTIGILLKARIDGYFDSLKEVLVKLKGTGFWISDKLMTQLLIEAGESL